MKAIKESSTFLRLSFVALVFCFASAVSAQTSDSPGYMNRASQYYLGEKDEILMNVNVWGFVKRPGQYMVPRHTDLISLISFAGGPVEGADLKHVVIVRGGQLVEATYNTDSYNAANAPESKVPILNVNVKEHLERGEISKIPVLQANDTIIVSQSSGHKVSKFFGFNSMFGVITAMASVALIVDRLSR